MAGAEEKKTIDPRNYEDVQSIADAIRQQLGESVAVADIGIICGSGLGPIGDSIENATILPYENIPGFMKTKVPGHKGNLVFGTLAGKRVVALQGRFHAYEHGMNLGLCAMPVRVMHSLGVRTLIASCAAGGVNRDFRLGDFMLVKDHISIPMLAGFSPLVGLSDPRFGHRFVSIHELYDRELRQLAHTVASKLGVRLHEGVLSQNGGPQYETPAEVSMFMKCGVDAVGMSICHEAVVAKQCEMRILGFCLITNVANLDSDNSELVSHEEVLQTADDAGERASTFVRALVAEL